MRVNVRCGAVAFLFVTACNRPDADLFGADGSPPNNGTDAGGTLSVTAPTTAGTGGATSGGSSSGDLAVGGTANGGSSDKPATGGDSATGGAPGAGAGPVAGAGGSVGGSSPLEQAGAPNGTAGKPELPKPVCGNGVLEAGEVCDDAGHAGKDGCDANCKVVCADYGPGTLESEDHHCYNGYDQGDFEAAQQACVKKGAHLATIASAAENQIARELVNDSKWLGGYESVPLTSEGTGTYTWLTGEAFTYTNWAPREPNRREAHCGAAFNTLCFEHCIAILGDGTWADARCDMSDGYVCEWEPAGTK